MSSSHMSFTRRELYNLLRSSGHTDIEDQFNFLKEEVQKRTECPNEGLKNVKQIIANFKSQFKSRWIKACRIEERFVKNNIEWLDTSILFPRLETRRGRPETAFELSSERTKRQKTSDLRKSTPLSVLAYATQMSLRASGKNEAAKVVQEISSSPKRATKLRDAYKKSLEYKPKMLSGEDALALLVDAKLSRHQYDLIRQTAPEKFPSYKKVQTAKKNCYPENIIVTSTSAEVNLQALLNHTVKRLLMVQQCVVESLKDEELDNLFLYTKWGFDGSSGHSSYKQAFHGIEACDAAVFISSLVPIRLVCGTKIIWQNPRPGSTRYCRPLKMQFIKESTAVSIAEKTRVDEQISHLQNTTTTIQQREVTVKHNLIFSMIDGKVCNALSSTTSTQKCYICGATSKSFNNIDEMINRQITTENLQFGLSILHGWIRFFECLLHVAYKLPIKKWQARGDDKNVVAENKARIQKEFKDLCGLIVDKPKPGFGNSNDGNTARRFFENAEISAKITKIDVALIEKIHTILIVVASGHEIKIETFRMFCHSTARYFVEKYPWYCMPPTLHKYFIHGPEIISSALLPIGQLTEEAQEACNKDFKRYREHNSRKCSREKCNEDVFNFFLLSSDPLLSSKRTLPKKKIQHLPKQALEFLKCPSVDQRESDSESESDDSKSDDDY